MDKKLFSLEQIYEDCSSAEKEILDLYLKRVTQNNICDVLETTRGKIDGLVKRYNLTRFRTRNLYTVNEDLITLENPEFCYFLGLFASDGNINKTNSGSEVVQFTMKDLEILQHIKNILQYTGEIKTYDKGKVGICYYIGITNKKLSSFLKEHIAETDKTHTLKFPNIVDKTCTLMFIRGFIDGDGSYAKTKYEGKYVVKLFCASSSFLEIFKDKITEMIRIYPNIYENNYLEINSISDIKAFFYYLYKYKPELSLTRKRVRAEEHMRYV